jgi:hypothetical protein
LAVICQRLSSQLTAALLAQKGLQRNGRYIAWQMSGLEISKDGSSSL